MSVHPHHLIKMFSVLKTFGFTDKLTRLDNLCLRGMTNPQPQVILRTNCSDTINVTPHLNINIIKWNITHDNIKGQFAEYQVTPYKYPRYLKNEILGHTTMPITRQRK